MTAIWSDEAQALIAPKSVEQLEREEIIRQTLEAAAMLIEDQYETTNATYRQALKKATRIIRGMKP